MEKFKRLKILSINRESYEFISNNYGYMVGGGGSDGYKHKIIKNTIYDIWKYFNWYFLIVNATLKTAVHIKEKKIILLTGLVYMI